jgi:hypothetical protein
VAGYAILVRSDIVDKATGPLLPDSRRAVRIAINETIDWARARAARDMRGQVAFPASYLGPAGGRLTITKKASDDDLAAIVTGRHRATSLARFATNARVGVRGGARVQVEPGLARFLPKAFFIPLRSGNTDTKNNVGLAIRLPDGKVPSRAYKPQRLGRGLWLLYGPSVDQVFDDVAEDISPEAAERLGDEYLRQLDLVARR